MIWALAPSHGRGALSLGMGGQVGPCTHVARWPGHGAHAYKFDAVVCVNAQAMKEPRRLAAIDRNAGEPIRQVPNRRDAEDLRSGIEALRHLQRHAAEVTQGPDGLIERRSGR
jgi:hypothetical protein